MLMLYCLIAHSIVISRRPTMRVTTTGNWQAAPLTCRFWNRSLGTIVPPGRLTFAGYVPVKNVLISPVDRPVDWPVEPTGHRSGRVMKISTGSISALYRIWYPHIYRQSSRFVTLQSLRANIDWKSPFSKGVGHFGQIFQVEGDVPHQPFVHR